MAWDLAPHDISIILHLLGESPSSVNCSGNAHVTPEIEDVTNMSLTFSNQRFATIQSSWLEPRKVREMTIVGTQRMIVYDDLQTAREDPASMMSGWSVRRTTIPSRNFIIPIITGTATSRISSRKSRSKRNANTSSTASKTGHRR